MVHAGSRLLIMPLWFVVLGKMASVAREISCGEGVCVNFKLLEGYSAETSGGLLVCLPKEQAEWFCKEIKVRTCIYPITTLVA